MSDVKSALHDLREESLSGSSINARLAPKRVPPQMPQTGWVLGAGVILVASVAAWFTLAGKANYPLVPPTPPLAAGETPAKKDSAFPASPSPASTGAPVTNDQVIEMVKSGIDKSIIISHIRNSKTNFTFSTEDLIKLAKGEVPGDIIDAMRNPRVPDTAATGGAAPVSPPQVLHAILNASHEVPLLAASDIPFSAAGDGSRIEFVVAEDVKAGDQVVIAKGATGFGSLIDAEKDVAVARDSAFTATVEQDTAVSVGLSQK